MPFPTFEGMTPGSLRRLASQAAWEMRRSGRMDAAVRYWLAYRVPGAPEAAYTWAMRTAQRMLTARTRSERAGPKATFGSLFRGNQGLSPGYSAVVRVTYETPDGQKRVGRYVITGLQNSQTIQSAKDRAVSMAQASARQQRRAGRRSGSDVPIYNTDISGLTPEVVIESFVAQEGAP